MTKLYFPINEVEQLYICIQKLPYAIYRINLKCITDKNISTKTIKNLEENVEESFYEIRIVRDFLNITLNPRSLKEKKR